MSLLGGEIFRDVCVPGIGGALPVLGTPLGLLSLDNLLNTLPLLNMIGRCEFELSFMHLKRMETLNKYY